MSDHDHSYKHLFGHPELIRDLLQGFIHEPWVAELDLSTLERVNGSYVTADLREREDDLIWRVRFRERWIYLYLLIEFQSTVDRYMAVRLLTYLGLLYQDLIQGGEIKGGRLPPVLPLVLYNGGPRWRAALSIEELIEEVPGGLSRYRPHFQYLLLDEGHFDPKTLPERNLVAAIFRLESSAEVDDINRVLESLIDWLHAPEQTSLRRAFHTWINRIILPLRLPGQRLPQVNDLTEMHAMLAERVKQWTREWEREGLQKGLQKGRAEGLQEGLQKGIRDGLIEAIELGLSIKFGAEGERLLPRVRQIEEVDRLRAIKEVVKVAATLAEVEVAL